jgi:elongation factor Ts
MITIDQVKELRDETSVSVQECKKALQEANGDKTKAKEILMKWGKDLASKKSTRGTTQGIIASYIHANGKVGVLLDLACETDFVAKSDDFKNLAHELCLQVAAINNETDLLAQAWIKDPTKTIKNLIEDYVLKIGENIVVNRFTRYEI